MKLKLTSQDGISAVLDVDEAEGGVTIESGGGSTELDVVVAGASALAGAPPPWIGPVDFILSWADATGVEVEGDIPELPGLEDIPAGGVF